MLTLVPTPIGNLDDLSFRSLEALRCAELFFCEDTRVTKKLLHLLETKFNTTFPCQDFRSLHHHNEQKVLNTLDPNELKSKSCVFVSDAGMPCISDPGATLVQYCIENNIEYDVLPGANAVLTAFAMSGFENHQFSFYGFLPHKGSHRTQELQKVLNSSTVPILYESPHRLLKLLEELYKEVPNRRLFLAKEITKLHQKTFKGTCLELYQELKKTAIKGEWVVILEPIVFTGEMITLEDIESLDCPPKQKAKLIAKFTGKNVKEIYNTLI